MTWGRFYWSQSGLQGLGPARAINAPRSRRKHTLLSTWNIFFCLVCVKFVTIVWDFCVKSVVTAECCYMPHFTLECLAGAWLACMTTSKPAFLMEVKVRSGRLVLSLCRVLKQPFIQDIIKKDEMATLFLLLIICSNDAS